MRRFAEIIRKRQEQPRVREAISLTEVSVEGLAGKGVTADTDNSAPPDLLLLVDEADTWPTAKLRTLFRNARTWQPQHVRVLLTARASSTWWAGLQAELHDLEIASDALRLGPLDAAAIRKLADAAGRSLAKAQDKAQPAPLPNEVLNQLANSPPLSIELMVLARQHASMGRMPTDLRAAVEVILEKEQRYWARLYGLDDSDPNRLHLKPALMARAVYVSTLTGPLPADLALEVIQHAQISSTADPQQVIDDHARCYPPSRLPADRLAPLAACLAEEFLGILVPDGRAETDVIFSDFSDPWADSAPFRVLGLLPPQQRKARENAQRRAAAAGIEASPAEPKYPSAYTFGPQLDTAILRLVRAASTRPHLAEQQLYPLARHYPKAVVMADNTALTELLAFRPAPPADVLNALEEAVRDCDRGNLKDYCAALAALTRSTDGVVPCPAAGDLR
jgi:hypothetical protein